MLTILTMILRFQVIVSILIPCVFIMSMYSSICLKDQVGKILPQLLQLEEGLQTCGLLDSNRATSAVWKTALVIGKGIPVTANSLIESFDVLYSDSQAKQEAEADTYTYFCDFIHSVDMNGVLYCSMYCIALMYYYCSWIIFFSF